jgi:hypothetical protein
VFISISAHPNSELSSNEEESAKINQSQKNE